MKTRIRRNTDPLPVMMIELAFAYWTGLPTGSSSPRGRCSMIERYPVLDYFRSDL
jgi:hypothetical protein